jgi:hypothetical protein
MATDNEMMEKSSTLEAIVVISLWLGDVMNSSPTA